MARTLAAAIHLTDAEGIVHSFLPGDTPPKWARKKITNPKAWTGDASGDDSADDDSTENASDETHADGSEASSDSDASGDGSKPPRKNGSTDAWKAYADRMGFEIDDDVTRADIIAALNANGIPTE